MNEKKNVSISNQKTNGVRDSESLSGLNPPKQGSYEQLEQSNLDQTVVNNNDKPEEQSSGNASKNKQAQTNSGGVGKSGKPSNKSEIRTLEQFIRQAYAKKVRKVTLKQNVERQIAQDPRLSQEARQGLIELAQKDLTFAVPRQLLLVAWQVNTYPGLRASIRDFVKEVMLSHPVFFDEQMIAAIHNRDDAPTPDVVLTRLASLEIKDLRSGVLSSLKASDIEQLRINIVYCVALWLFAIKGLSIATLIDLLFTSLWAPKADKLVVDTEKLDAVSRITDLQSVGLVCNEYRLLADERLHERQSAIGEAEALRSRVQSLEEELDAVCLKVTEIEERSVAEQQTHLAELASIRATSETEAAHLRNNFEVQRTRLLRRLKSDVDLLDEGLHALSRAEPKIHVMVDHAERVTDALRQEIKNLQGE